MPPPSSRAEYIGKPLRRYEDRRLITGTGLYCGDVQLDGLAHLAISRSPLPHGRILSIETEAAKALPGVLAVWTAADLGPAAWMQLEAPRNMAAKDWPVLASREVNFVGDAVAAVVAEDAYLAQDAVQAIFADLEPLDGAGNVPAAIAAGAPRVHEDLESNVTGERSYTYGDVESAFEQAAVTVKQRITTSRVAGASMEPRVVTAAYDAQRDALTVWTSTQAVFTVRDRIAKVLGVEPERVVVRAQDIGGGFGEKGPAYPEEVLCAFAARQLRRPVRWTATRSEHTATTVHGHGSVFDLEIAADADGRLRGVRGDLFHDFGAYVGSAVGQPSVIIGHMLSAYVIPAMDMRQHLVYTNAVPGGYIRGGGRPIGNFVIERMMDLLAQRLGLDPVELRRRNLIQPEQMPFDTHFPSGRNSSVVYDSGNYPELLEAAADGVDYAAVKRGAQDGRLVGAAVVCCVESTGFGGQEPARIRIEPDGSVHLYVGSSPQGQGHQTMAAQVAAERLGWPIERVTVTAADTRYVPHAMVTAGSRTAVQVGNAAAKAATAALERLREHASERLSVYPSEIVIEDGTASVSGAGGRGIPVTELVPPEGIDVLEIFNPDMPLAYSSGCHAAVVAVDPETGHVDVLRYVIACDNGRSINPLLVEGQLQGGYAHGLGYALYEEAIYQDDGNFVSSSFLDYTIVGAPETATEPQIVKFETHTRANPESFKGAGESGTIPVPAAIAAAVEDALSSTVQGAVIDQIPITPSRIHELLTR